jgi:hypothetical protein
MTTVFQIPASVSQGSVPHAASMSAQPMQSVAQSVRHMVSASMHIALHCAPGFPPPHVDWQVIEMPPQILPPEPLALLLLLLLLLAVLLLPPPPCAAPLLVDDDAPVPPVAPLPTVISPPVAPVPPPAPVDVVAGSTNPAGSKRSKSMVHADSASRASAEARRIRTSRVRP